LKEPKVYFFDTGYVLGDEGVKWENACAAMLLKHSDYQQDALGMDSRLHYLRTKDGAEVDFVLGMLWHVVACWGQASGMLGHVGHVGVRHVGVRLPS